VLDRLEQHQPQPFVAPVPEADTVRLFTLDNGIPYWFTVRNAEPGWWELSPYADDKARLTRKANPSEFFPYLSQLPRYYVVALFRLSEHTWLCVPFNSADAHQRGWKDAEPRPLHLIRHSVSPLDVVSARMMSSTLLYEDIDMRIQRVPPNTTDSKRAEWIIRQHRLKQEEEERKRALEEQKLTTEGRMKYQLGLAGAELMDWSERGEGLSVTWHRNGRTYNMTVNRNLTIASAGICLDSTDSTHDLATIVSTMERS